jgi:hypothetical protein
MEAGAQDRHLGIKHVEQSVMDQTAPQELGPLTQKPAVLAQQGPIHRLQLQHHPIQPLPAQGGFPPHQRHVKSTEAHAAQATQQIQLTIEGLPVAQSLPATTAPEMKLQAIPFHR